MKLGETKQLKHKRSEMATVQSHLCLVEDTFNVEYESGQIKHLEDKSGWYGHLQQQRLQQHICALTQFQLSWTVAVNITCSLLAALIVS